MNDEKSKKHLVFALVSFIILVVIFVCIVIIFSFDNSGGPISQIQGGNIEIGNGTSTMLTTVNRANDDKKEVARRKAELDKIFDDFIRKSENNKVVPVKI